MTTEERKELVEHVTKMIMEAERLDVHQESEYDKKPSASHPGHWYRPRTGEQTITIDAYAKAWADPPTDAPDDTIPHAPAAW